MKNLFRSQLVKMIFPYFILAIMVIVTFRLINEIEVFFAFVRRLWGIATPFFYGFLLAYCLSIPCGGVEKLLGRINRPFFAKRKKAFSVVLIYILFLFLLYLVFNLIIPSIADSIRYFTANMPAYYTGIQSFVDFVNELDIEGVSVSMEEILSLLPRLNLEALSAPMSMLFGVGSAILTTFLTFISSVYILFAKDAFKVFLCRVLGAFTSAQTGDTILKYARRLNTNFKRYIYAQTIDGLILGSLVTLELYFIGSEYFLLLGVTIGILNYIPYFGPIFGTIAATLVVLLTQGLTTGLVSGVILFVTQQIDGNIILPRLLGGSFSLPPLLIIVSIVTGGALYGVFGMIAVVPIVAVCKDIFDNVLLYYEQKKRAPERMLE